MTAVDRRRFVGVMGAAVAGSGLGVDRWAAVTGGASDRARPLAPQEDPRVQALYRLVEAKMAEYRVPGVGLGLLSPSGLWQRGFGLTNLDNPQPVDVDTVFPIASISKTVIATALARLAQEGRVDLDAPVRTYLPDFRVADAEASRSVTVRHLLTHTPGWEGQLGTPDRGPDTLRNFVEGLADLPQLARPGEVWSYNNAGFGVAGRVIEVVAGDDIGGALDDLVFEPLGLTHAFSHTGTAMTHRFAAPHRTRDGGVEVIRPFSLPANVAAGGTAMSIATLMRYAAFHLGRPPMEGYAEVVSLAGRAALREPRVTKNATTDEMGTGWHLRRLGGVRTAAHGGTLGGHCLHVQLVPERDFAFAILTNHADGWRLIHDVERWILDTFLDLRLAPGQATGGNRGGNEIMTSHADALAVQPDPAEYVGTYDRTPSGSAEVRAEGGRLFVRGGGAGGADVPLVFWGPDLTYTDPGPDAGYPYAGMPVEFIRDGGGSVRWIRINGRIARRG